MSLLRLFYAAPEDVGDAATWKRLSVGLERAVKAGGGPGVTVEVGAQPIFAPGKDGDEALRELEEQETGWRHVRIDPWCAFPVYFAVGLTFGNGFVRKQLREIKRRIRKLDPRLTPLYEHEGVYDLDAPRVYGYDLDPANPEDAASLEHLMIPFRDGVIYLGEPWVFQERDESVDRSKFEIFPVGPNLSLVSVLDGEVEVDLWMRSAAGLGLLAIDPADPAEAALKRRFADRDDLRILVGEAPFPGMRLAIYRTPEAPLVVYDPNYAAEIDDAILFAI